MKRSTEWTQQPQGQKALKHPLHGPGGSLTRAAPAASKLIQQVDEEVDSFQKGCVFVSRGSQELGVNVLVGFEDCIFFNVTAALKNKRKKER